MKNIKWFALLCLLGVLFTSCKEEKSEWKIFYGYTNQDVVGTYSSSGIEEAYEGLIESPYCHICRDAEVKITPSGSKLRIEVKSGSTGLNWSDVGNPCLNDNDFIMQLGSAPELDFMAKVYTNEAKQIRLHGYVRRNQSTTYHFDVVKE
jgi:hypothetical protein